MTIDLRDVRAIALGALLTGAATPAIAQQCQSGWTGTINYKRTQSVSDNKTVPRISGKGTQTTNFAMNYDYGARIAVRALAEAGLSAGRADISHTQTATETTSSQDIQVCPHTYERRQVSGTSTSQSKTRAQASGQAADVNISEDSDGTYSVSVVLPEVRGMTSGSQSSSYSGQCTPKKGSNASLPETPSTIDGVRFGTEGADRMNPSDPNRLTGSYTKTWQNVTETLSWNLRRCGPALRLVDLKFEDMKYPNWDDWGEIVEQRGTIDGNRVRIIATVANDGGEERAATVRLKETYKGDKWDGARADKGMDELSVTIPAGEQREVKFDWDSSGYAWFDDGRPRLVQRIRAELEDKGKKVDETVKNLKVAPRPLVLVHGLWSTWRAWEPWQNILTTSHSYDWKAFPVGEKPEHGLMDTGQEFGRMEPTASIGDNARHLESYIEYARKDRNAWHVDLVAHSMGGLISRYYISQIMPAAVPDGKPIVSRLVMLGTPNMGSRCASFMHFAGEMVGKDVEALRQLSPDYLEGFNKINTARKNVEFSVLAGDPLPTMCGTIEWNDGVVPVSSAIWGIGDNARLPLVHTDLTGTEPFSKFVKPRLAIGPAAAKRSASGSGAASARLMLTLDGTDPAAASRKPDFAKLVKLAPNQTLEVSIPVKEARNLGLTFVAASAVSATLIDDKGAVAATNRTNTAQASQPFRSLFVDRPVASANWTLRLENIGEIEREVLLASWSSAR